MRTIRYQEIAAAVRERVEQGRYAPGRLLPSEAEMSAEVQARRVTIRRALETLRDDGVLAARQGLGRFVATEPLRQALGQLHTIEGQLADSGIVAERRIIEFAFGRASAAVRKALSAEQVLRVKRVNMADG